MLKIEHLTKYYNNKIIINNFNLAVKNGEIAILLGSSGVGKSTILRILNNLEDYNSGKFYLDNKLLDLKTVNKNNEIGMIFQHFNLFENMSVIKNITFPLEKATNKKPQEALQIAYQLLEKYNLSEKADNPINSLSGGQKQRLSIARTLALKPRVICMDEPTSALDPLLTNNIARNIKELADNNFIIIIATHDISLVEKLPCTLYLMEKGSIIEKAFAQEYYKNKEKYPALKNFLEGHCSL